MGGDLEDADSVLLEAARAIMAISVRAAEGLPGDISAVQLRSLTILSRLKEANLADLGAALGLSPSSTSRLCDRLVARGMVDRRASPRTRREVLVRLTERGTTVLADYDRQRISDLRSVLDQLPAAQRPHVVDAFREFVAVASAIENRTATG